MEYHPISWPMLRVWLLLLTVAALFGVRAALAALWRAWRRHQARVEGLHQPPTAATRR